jgi:hypothetical protein
LGVGLSRFRQLQSIGLQLESAYRAWQSRMEATWRGTSTVAPAVARGERQPSALLVGLGALGVIARLRRRYRRRIATPLRELLFREAPWGSCPRGRAALLLLRGLSSRVLGTGCRLGCSRMGRSLSVAVRTRPAFLADCSRASARLNAPLAGARRLVAEHPEAGVALPANGDVASCSRTAPHAPSAS